MASTLRVVPARRLPLLPALALAALAFLIAGHSPAWAAAPDAPGAVQDLEISRVARKTLTVTWNAPDPAPTASYEIELFTGTDTTATALKTKSLGANKDPLQVVFTGLTPGTQYTVSVKAYNRKPDKGGKGFVKSAASPAATTAATTIPYAPGVPTNLTVLDFSDTLVVKWDPPTGKTPKGGYIIEVFEGSSATGSPVKTRTKGPEQETRHGQPERRVSVSGLTPGTQYTVSVKAQNRTEIKGGGGYTFTSGGAVTETLTTIATPDAPAVVTDIKLTQRQEFDLIVTWTPPDPAPTWGYAVDLFVGNAATKSQHFWAKKRGSKAESARFSLEPEDLGETYTVSVQARNKNGNDHVDLYSDWSTAVTGTIEMKAVPSAPGPVTDLTVNKAFNTGVEVEWTAPDPAPTGGYLVEAYNAGSRVVDKAQQPGSKATSAYIYNLTQGDSYTIRVKSRNWIEGVGYSDYSTVVGVSATTATPTAPGAVTGLAFDDDKTYANSLAATWTAPNPAPTGKYIIELFSGSSAAGTPLTIRHRDPKLKLEAKFTGLTKGTQYTIRVRAQNAYDHEIVAGTAATATGTTGPAAGLPARPTNLSFATTATADTNYSVTFTWDAPLTQDLGGRAVKNYILRIFSRHDDGLERDHREVKAPDARTVSRTLEYCTTYRVQVRTVTDIGVSPWATTWIMNEYQKGGTEMNPTYTNKCEATE